MYKISDKTIEKRKTRMYMILSFIFFIVICSFVAMGDVESNWLFFVLVSLIIMYISYIKIILEFKSFKIFASTHSILLGNGGLVFDNTVSYNTIPWNQIFEVKQKIKAGKLLSIDLKTSSGIIVLNSYENLEGLALELKKFIKKDLWV